MASTTAAPHLRHPPHHENAGEDIINEKLPLLRHLSLDDKLVEHGRVFLHHRKRIVFFALAFLAALFCILYHPGRPRNKPAIVPIEQAKEHVIEVEPGIKVWFRTWGNRNSGVPVLFVHGGPGQAVADYHNGNKRFFDASKCFVVEVDQRGTGNSQPSVRDSWHNMQYYSDISIGLIAEDYEVIRKYIGIDQWLVWGGSYGSTIGLNYAMMFPDSCIALILRGIYLDTIPEMKEVYTKDAFLGNPKRLKEFNNLFKVAAQNVDEAGEKPLDPNDVFRLFRVYERMITQGDRQAIWAWHSFENNLMEEDPKNMLDPNVIDEKKFAEAQNVAFFETRLWLHGTIEKPSNLLKRIDRLSDIPVWICQGLRDKVCPPENAQHLVDALEETEGPLTANFIDSGHEDTDPVMEKCLKQSIHTFLNFYDEHY
jgi:proline iminopeptidase